jgi:hypothetical protein
MSRFAHWADVLKLRAEITDTAGEIADLQMSLYSAVYQTRDVPYQDVTYYSDITEPTPGILRFMGAVARRLDTPSSAGKALFHLDQGMGGGKSHALVGLWHLAHDPAAFFATELGRQVLEEAERPGGAIGLTSTRVVVLSADNMSPGRTSPEFGPATTLYERFLWALFAGDRAAYQGHLAEGPNKAALVRALEAVGGPVLILLDELMDYAMGLSDEAHLGTMPGEKVFLNALMDAVDDVPRVAFVLVMIRSDVDERGYTVEAEDFRGYITARLERNGTTVAVTEAQDFSAIIRRRLFERFEAETAATAIAAAVRDRADLLWQEQVFERLGSGRGLVGSADRLAATYPFHPDLMTLVRNDWSRHAGFQRVRSTVEIFAATAHHWVVERRVGRWAPDLIGIGDIPLTVAIEQVLSSGLLHGNERAIQGFRQVAAADVSSKDGTRGRAIELDAALTGKVDLNQPAPAVRMATALFCYSLVPRAQAKRGATKAELLVSVFEPRVEVDFTAAEEVFNVLVGDEGLGALEVAQGSGGNVPTRYQLAITQTLRMFYKQAKASVQSPERDEYMWERSRALANQGPFDELILVAKPSFGARLGEVFAEVDQNGKNRLVVLDPRHWTLLNGRDGQTRADVEALLGCGAHALPVDNAASCVVACADTQRRDGVRKRATEVLAWRAVLLQLDPDSDRRADAEAELRHAEQRFDADLFKTFQHFAFVIRTSRVEVEWRRFDDDARSALKGHHVWDALVASSRATKPGTLSGAYLETLLGAMARNLTLKEVSQQFTKNPAFPLVESLDDVRRAIYQTLSGEGRYELVDGNGDALAISSPEDLSIGSMDHSLRKATPAMPPRGTGHENAETSQKGEPNQIPNPPLGSGASDYRRFMLEVPNRSLVDAEIRRHLANLLMAMMDAVDPETGGDLQLIDLKVNLTAIPEAVSEIKERATNAEARWDEEDLDF